MSHSLGIDASLRLNHSHPFVAKARTMNPSELYQAGQLNAAIEAAIAEVKKKPTDGNTRFFLAELLCFAGEWERADKQLDTVAQQTPELAIRISLVRHILRAEMARQQFYSDGRVPEFLFEVSPMLRHHLDASIAFREGNLTEASDQLAQSESSRPPRSGQMGGTPFDDFRDCDDLTAGFFEVLTSTGKYYWVPIDCVRSIEFHTPERPLDLLWRRVAMDVVDGPDGEVYLPVLYAGSAASGDSQLQLGRGTTWQELGSVVRGCGQRLYLVGDEAVPILQLQNIEFHCG